MSERRAVKRTVVRLACGACLMFGFGFALVPLYEVFCDLTGINGKGDWRPGSYESENKQTAELTPSDLEKIAPNNQVKVQFVAVNNESLPWEFRPEQFQIKVIPGVAQETSYYARNLSQREITVQAVPSVAPGRAAKYLKKMECFCFERQTLAPGEAVDMGLRFVFDEDMPEDLRVVSLSYTLFDVGNIGARALGGG